MEILTTAEIDEYAKNLPTNLRGGKEFQTKMVSELFKYKWLEEHIGCPLEVRCKITNGLSIYDKEGNRWIISQIEETYIDVYSSKDSYYTMIFPYDDYKKSWWLKQNRSE